MSNDATRFGLGHASGDGWHAATQACVAQLDPPAGANLGFVYVTDELADELGKITALLVQETGVVDWVGTTGLSFHVQWIQRFGKRLRHVKTRACTSIESFRASGQFFHIFQPRN